MTSVSEQLAELRNEITRAEGRLADLQIQAIDMRVAAAVFRAE